MARSGRNTAYRPRHIGTWGLRVFKYMEKGGREGLMISSCHKFTDKLHGWVLLTLFKPNLFSFQLMSEEEYNEREKMVEKVPVPMIIIFIMIHLLEM